MDLIAIPPELAHFFVSGDIIGLHRPNFLNDQITAKNNSMARDLRKKKETWYRDLRGPLLRLLQPRLPRKMQKMPLPTWAKEPWLGEIAKRMDGAVNQSLNLKGNEKMSPEFLGVLCAQAENCSEMRIAPFLKNTSASAKGRRMSKKLWSYFSTGREMLGKVGRKIRQVMARQPFEVQIAFLNAHARAAEKKMFQKDNPVFWETPASRLYLTLMFLAPWMHQVKSVRHLHEIMLPRLGTIVGRDPKRLEKVCERIGLKFRERGRPRGAATSAP